MNSTKNSTSKNNSKMYQKRHQRVHSLYNPQSTKSQNQNNNNSYYLQYQSQKTQDAEMKLSKFNIPSPLKKNKQNPNYSFADGPSFLDQSVVEEKAKTKLPHFKPSTSLAEENLVKNFNKFTKLENISLPTNQPQRIELPLFFNTPGRTQQFRSNTLNKKGIPNNKIQSADYIRAQRRLQDYNMLGFACRRAGKIRDEGRSYYSQGVLCDNMQKYKDAIVHYKKFLQVCKTIGDTHGESLAYNCIGVNYQLLGESNPQLYQDAILYHQRHLELADINGKFLALINLGLCYDRIGNYEESQIQYQNALRHSIQMSNLVGQTIAVGNIGKIGTKGLHANKERMKVFVEKYMKLSNELRDKDGEINACIKLGQLDIQSYDYQNGKQQFEKALDLAQQVGDQSMFSYSKCGYAITNVESDITDYMKQYQSKVTNNDISKLQIY